MIKWFDSDAVRLIANFAKLPRNKQNLPLGKTEAETVGDEMPPDSRWASKRSSSRPNPMLLCLRVPLTAE